MHMGRPRIGPGIGFDFRMRDAQRRQTGIPCLEARRGTPEFLRIGRAWEAACGYTERFMNQGLKQNNNDQNLTRLELICLTLVANGMSLEEIARRVTVSEQAIETLLDAAQHKLGARNRLNAVAIAIRKGLIGIEV